RERAKEEECEELQAKYEAAMTNFEKNPTVMALQEKISKPLTLDSKITSLEAEKARLEAIEVSLRREVEELKQDRREVMLKVGYEKLMPATILATATFPWLDEFVADPSTTIEALLSKKVPSLQRPAPSRTQVLLPSSQRVTPSLVLVSNPMSPIAYVSVVKPQSSQLQ
ncbi:hypothetical protein Tco_1289074, partial [Tanacetum coccineum]